MRVLVVFLACLGVLALSAGGAAASYAPPGNAGIQQYYDPLPSSGGDVAAPGSSNAPANTGAGQSGSLPAGLQHRLAAQGAAGAAVARLIAANAVTASRTTGRVSGRGSGESGGHGSSRHAGSSAGSAGSLPPLPLTAAPRGGLAQFLDAAVTGSGGGGVGILLPLVLVGALGVVVAGVVRRRRAKQ
jgi:hypothetical protein